MSSPKKWQRTKAWERCLGEKERVLTERFEEELRREEQELQAHSVVAPGAGAVRSEFSLVCS